MKHFPSWCRLYNQATDSWLARGPPREANFLSYYINSKFIGVKLPSTLYQNGKFTARFTVTTLRHKNQGKHGALFQLQFTSSSSVQIQAYRIGQKVDIEHNTQISWLNQSTGIVLQANEMSVSIQAGDSETHKGDLNILKIKEKKVNLVIT